MEAGRVVPRCPDSADIPSGLNVLPHIASLKLLWNYFVAVTLIMHVSLCRTETRLIMVSESQRKTLSPYLLHFGDKGKRINGLRPSKPLQTPHSN